MRNYFHFGWLLNKRQIYDNWQKHQRTGGGIFTQGDLECTTVKGDLAFKREMDIYFNRKFSKVI